MSVKLILASTSPRRREMLAALDLAFDVEGADIDESPRPGEMPDMYVRRLAREKAKTVAARHDNRVHVLAADTAVSIHGKIFGKPTDAADARRMLAALDDGDHLVSTGYAIASPGGRVVDGVVATKVSMRPLSSDEINWYIATGEPFDKAGGYAIQGRAAHFITRVDGSVSNVIGLPLAEVVLLLRAFGFPVATQGQPL